MTYSLNASDLRQFPTRSERLESWKEIANYLRREVRTVQLWEKKEGLPVHRHFHRRLGSVFAFREEIEEWASRASRKNIDDLREATPTEIPEPAKTGTSTTVYVVTTHEGPISAAEKSLCDEMI